MTPPENGADARRKGAEKVGQMKTINFDRLLIRFALMNMGPVAS